MNNMQKKKLTIILPTFNESSNIMPILEAIEVSLINFSHDYEIIFVDDSSDDTTEVIKDSMKIYTRVRLLHREKKDRTGLATAFVSAFKKAKGEYILCMDSDLQHPPEEIKNMFQKAIDDASDIVVASRYIKGGSAEGLGSKYRIFVSRVVTRFSAWLLLSPTIKSTDPGSGMFIIHKDIVDNLSFDKVYGFKILIDILTRAPEAKVSEHPIVFRKRENEESKATIKQGLQFYKHIWSLFLQYRFPIIAKKIFFCIILLIMIAIFTLIAFNIVEIK